MQPVSPTHDYPLPDDKSEQVAPSLQENARIAANTAHLMFELGMPFEMTAEDEEAARKLFEQVDKKKNATVKQETVNPPALYQGSVALKLSALLNEYDHRVVIDAAQARTYIMNRLLEISSCGDTKHELRAIELMGKMSDIGAFSEKSELTVTHRSADDLKQVLHEKITRLLNGTVVDVQVRDVKEELGLVEEVSAAPELEESLNPADELDSYITQRAKKVQEGAADDAK